MSSSVLLRIVWKLFINTIPALFWLHFIHQLSRLEKKNRLDDISWLKTKLFSKNLKRKEIKNKFANSDNGFQLFLVNGVEFGLHIFFLSLLNYLNIVIIAFFLPTSFFFFLNYICFVLYENIGFFFFVSFPPTTYVFLVYS